ncbi:30S ribosomal protein S7 [Candidatus Peregrinibacteria bacterium]|jgi:small subunit ribosomal protein S7|nr:30S ribosomal protein S7 [Candidatus Peregrinibacteria bacterium]
MSNIKPFIPQNSNPIQEKFINYLMQRGKKGVARKIFKDMLKIMSDRGAKNPEKTFEIALANIKPTLEVRPKRIAGAVYQIPLEVTPRRQQMLAFRWILNSAKAKKGKPMAECLAGEMMEASEGIGNAIKKKEESHKMAAANKAFAHFARY